MTRRFLLISVAILALVAGGPTLFGAERFDQIRDRILQYVDKEHIPSISIAIVKGDEILWEEGYGWADVENRVKATPHTAYMLGSVSKSVTATILMLLNDRGLINLDRPANAYLGHARIRSRLGDASSVTVRDILQHTGGLPNYYETFYADEKEMPPSVELVVREYGYTMIPRGRFHYSNLGHTLLDHIASRVSGKAFAEVARRELFVPLGMKDSFVPTNIGWQKGSAIRYHLDGARLPEYITGVVPAADIHSSVHDLALFTQLHLKAVKMRLLSDRAIDAMQKQTVSIPNFSYEYGLGWSVGFDGKGRRHVFHGGGSAGCDAHLTLLPEKNLAFVILVNRTRQWPGTAVTQDLLDLTLASILSEDVKDVRLEFGEGSATVSRFAADLKGLWHGTVAISQLSIPITLKFNKDPGEVSAILDTQAATSIEEVRYLERIFLGKMHGDIGVPAAARRPYDLSWDLTMVDGKLAGVLYTGGRENSRGLLLPYWAELERRSE